MNREKRKRNYTNCKTEIFCDLTLMQGHQTVCRCHSKVNKLRLIAACIMRYFKLNGNKCWEMGKI